MTGRPGHRQAGFTLVELLISLVISGVALAIAAGLLQETAQQLSEVGGEQIEAPISTVLDRLRADVRAAIDVDILPGAGTRSEALLLQGLPAGEVVWIQDGAELRRLVLDPANPDRPLQDAPLLRGVESFRAGSTGGLVSIELTYRRERLRPPSPVVPGQRGERTELRSEALLLAPRGAGLGDGW
jgi:prepilin-type N-terminal cleavage/methylation domain-containing protein